MLSRRMFIAATFALLPTPLLAAPTSDLSRLTWLVGRWRWEKADGSIVEEFWTPPEGDGMVGVSRTVKQGRTVFTEFLQIRLTDGQLAYIAHPQGAAKPTRFPLKSLAEGEVVFENLEHDFPQRIIYRQTAPTRITARVEGLVKGRLEGEDYPYVRKVNE